MVSWHVRRATHLSVHYRSGRDEEREVILPHGGELIDKVVPEADRRGAAEAAQAHTSLELTLDRAKEVENIAHGLLSPLVGFMGREDYQSVLDDMRLANGLPWTIPIVLEVPADSSIKPGDEIALAHEGKAIAVMLVEERWTFDKAEHAAKVFGATDEAHPGVAQVMAMDPDLVSGPILLFDHTEPAFPEQTLYPKETRALFEGMGWETVVGFQTRNVPHLGHEFVQKTALSHVDGLFINPVVGNKKAGDFLDSVILDSYKALIDNYYPADRATLVVLQTQMRYAGPREAVFHAIMRKNFGNTHFIVGRDHAGVGDYYDPFAAHAIFDEFEDLDIEPVFFRSFFYCQHCGGPANEKTCPHEGDEIIQFSGTRMRELLVGGEIPPRELMREEVARIMLEAGDLFVT
jgi:sulfate adenylyltransferase